MRLHRSSIAWFVAIVLAWAGVLAWVAVPASWWLEVEVVHVEDAAEGEAPRMHVGRVIHRPFRAEWVATVMRDGGEGVFYTFCTASGINDYGPVAALPVDLDLDWWTYPIRCGLPPGRYLVKTLWTIDPIYFPEKVVRARSNIFTVHPAPL